MPSAYRCDAERTFCTGHCENCDASGLHPRVNFIDVDDGMKAQPALSNSFPLQGLTLEFLCGQHLRSAHFTESPLGIVFKPYKSPLQVKLVQPDGLAERLGVEPNWIVVSVDGEDVSHQDWRYVVMKIDSVARYLPRFERIRLDLPECLELDFEVMGEMQTVSCYKVPLGLRLAPGPAGLLVEFVAPDGHADQLGIQKGWTLQKVGKRSIVGEDPQDVLDSITTALSCRIPLREDTETDDDLYPLRESAFLEGELDDGSARNA